MLQTGIKHTHQFCCPSALDSVMTKQT